MSAICGIYSYSGKKENHFEQEIVSMLGAFNRRAALRRFYFPRDNKVAFGSLATSDTEIDSRLISRENRLTRAGLYGKIYNYKALREILEDKGYIFKENSDGEIIEHLYEERGTDCFNLIEGDFGIVLWDGRKNKLILARDKLGVKSLYYGFLDNKIIFASEIKGLLACPEFNVDLNEKNLFYYLNFNYSPAPLTMFEGVYKVKPGYYLEFDALGQKKEVQYWDVVTNTGICSGEKESIEKTRYLLQESVGRRMPFNQPVGCFLSGGRDSTAILALMSKFLDPSKINTFTIAFKSSGTSRGLIMDDLNSAREIARIFKTKHEEIIIAPEDVIGCLTSIAGQMEDLFSLSSIFYTYFISKFAKDKGVSIVLSGDGEEEIFFGYGEILKFYKKAAGLPVSLLKILPKSLLTGMSSLTKKMINNSFLENQYLLTHFLECMKRLSLGQELYWGNAMPFPERQRTGLFSEDFIERHVDFKSYSVIEKVLSGLYSKRLSNSLFEKMLYIDIKGWLAERYLLTLGRMSAASGLEIRFPFLDSSLVEFAMNVPQSIKFKGETSYLFNKSMKGLIPDWVFQRKKIFFPQPMTGWLSNEFILLAKEIILSSAILQKGYFNKKKIEKIFYNRSDYNENDMYRIFALYSLCIWFERWIKR